MPTLETLVAELKKVEEKLADAEGRMPAHSVRPGQMAAVFQLEEERDALTAEIQKLRHPPASECASSGVGGFRASPKETS